MHLAFLPVLCVPAPSFPADFPAFPASGGIFPAVARLRLFRPDVLPLSRYPPVSSLLPFAVVSPARQSASFQPSFSPAVFSFLLKCGFSVPDFSFHPAVFRRPDPARPAFLPLRLPWPLSPLFLLFFYKERFPLLCLPFPL